MNGAIAVLGVFLTTVRHKSLPTLKLQIVMLLPALLIAGIISVALFNLHQTAGGWDWKHSFLPATQAFLSGQNPYKLSGFYNPPWLFLVTIPFALLPENISSLAVGGMNFILMALLVYRVKANPYLALLAVFSPPIIWGFLLSNIDWIVLAGLFLPPQIGLFFVLIKPQVGIGIALYWLYQSWKKGKFLEILRVFSPVTAAYLLSFLLYGFYLGGSTDLSSKDWNTSFFPYSIIFGLLLMAFSIKKKKSEPAAAAAPFFSPYIGLSSWSITVYGVIKYPRVFFAANVVLWIYFILNKVF